MTTHPARNPAEVPGTGAERARRSADPPRRDTRDHWRIATEGGPHQAPVLQETFAVRRRRMRFRVDGRDVMLGAGEGIVVEPGQVHDIRNTGDETLEVRHEARPPDVIERCSSSGTASTSTARRLAAGSPRTRSGSRSWDLQDGYPAGMPPSLQQVALGGLAGFARRRSAPPWREALPMLSSSASGSNRRSRLAVALVSMSVVLGRRRSTRAWAGPAATTRP